MNLLLVLFISVSQEIAGSKSKQREEIFVLTFYIWILTPFINLSVFHSCNVFNIAVSLILRITFQCNYCQKHSFFQSIFLNEQRLSFVYYNCTGTVSPKIHKQDNYCSLSPLILRNAFCINYFLHQACCTLYNPRWISFGNCALRATAPLTVKCRKSAKTTKLIRSPTCIFSCKSYHP